MKRLLLICCCCIVLVSCDRNRGEEYHKESPFYQSQWSAIFHDGRVCDTRYTTILDFDLYDEGCLTIYSNDWWNCSKDLFTTQHYQISQVNENSWAIYNFRYNDMYCDLVIFSPDGQYADLSILTDNGYELDRYTIRRNNVIIDMNKFLID
jgi:hypothetical protein